MDIWRGSAKRELFPAGVGFENVVNVKMLPIPKSNYQLGNGEMWKLENGTGNIGNTGNIQESAPIKLGLGDVPHVGHITSVDDKNF